jgi:hypothetical protein
MAGNGANGAIEDAGIGPTPTPKCAIRREPDVSQTNPANPRTELIAALTEGIKTAALGGDLEAARVASEALGRLLAGAGATGTTSTAPVIALRAVQGHRGRVGGKDHR